MNIAHFTAHYRPIIGGQEVYISNLIGVCRDAGHNSIVYQLDRGARAEDAVCLPRIPYIARFFPDFDRKMLNHMIGLTRPKGLFSADSIIAHYAFHAPPLDPVRQKTIVLSHGVEWRVTNQSKSDLYCEANAKRCLSRFFHVVNDTHYLRHLGVDVPAATGYFTEVVPGVMFIPNCVDTNHFIPGPGLAEYAERKMILVPRQMVEDRGIHLAIEAFALIANEHPDYEMCLLGKRHNNKAPYIQRLDRLIQHNRLQERIYFRDPVPNLQMPKWYNSASITLIPTIAREGTSLSALESMSCGIPTISTNVAGLADLPTIQCEPTAESMAHAIHTTITESAIFGIQQRRTVCDTFNMANWRRGWMDAIASVESKSCSGDKG